MKWLNATRDSVPKDGQEVLISVNGVNQVAVYNSLSQSFKVNANALQYFIGQQTIYWIDIPKK